MMITRTALLCALSVAVGLGCVVEDDEVSSAGQASEMDDMGGGHGDCEAAPIMFSGDFNGNGVVDWRDLRMLNRFRRSGDYAAFFDMNADGRLDMRDIIAVARNLRQTSHPRDVQMAQLWASVLPYRDIHNAYAAGFVPFTPDLQGHGIHFANFDRIYSWGARGFEPGVPEGLNYTASGELVAAFYYAPGAIDLADYYPTSFPPSTYYKALDVPASFEGIMPHAWHNHIGPCFGGATSPVPGFDQCVRKDICYDDYGAELWSPKFHMLHVWLFEFNECGPFAGIDTDVSPSAPEEPNHMACDLADVVPVVVP